MRKIIVLVDDRGGIKAKIVPDDVTGTFLTKREFDKALRAAKLAYRVAKREYHRDQIKKRLEKENGKEHERVVTKSTRTEDTGHGIESNTRSETGTGRAPEEKPVPGNSSEGLARAVANAAARSRRAAAGEGSKDDATRENSVVGRSEPPKDA